MRVHITGGIRKNLREYGVYPVPERTDIQVCGNCFDQRLVNAKKSDILLQQPDLTENIEQCAICGITMLPFVDDGRFHRGII